MERLLYHGSGKIVEKPVFGEGNPRNDYGLGFYCTEEVALAREWACSEGGDGFANQYGIELSGLRILDLNGPGFNVLNWLAVLLENRIFDLRTPVAVQGRRYLLDNFLPNYKSADIIIGYRADDSYFSFSKAFLENSISYDQLQRAMYLGELGKQVVIRSKEAFDRLRFISAETVPGGIWFLKRIIRDRQARQEYFRMLEETPVGGASYMVNVMAEKWASDERVFL